MLADPLSLSGILKESRALATQKRRGSTPRRLPPHPPLGWVRARRTRTPKKRLRAEFSADIEPGEFPLNRKSLVFVFEQRRGASNPTTPIGFPFCWDPLMGSFTSEEEKKIWSKENEMEKGNGSWILNGEGRGLEKFRD
ncbi:hypothetical protein GWI33_021937 [Rhynchophorus ferrugineus]|uniref:Uncharacterized protein n=1 Tax=Rhynchophorus ferrugineus TaxID=354439 RepID=A0A834HMB9_RHYFE|nr:hypothetical protein GWI33_021937 [Rhynchophorus ferrugineus]